MNKEEIIKELVDDFIRRWCGENTAHLLDTDENAGTRLKKQIASQIDLAVAQRDKFWQDQEMGKSSDCQKHCEEAVAQALKEFDDFRDDDSCECDNCHRWRKFYHSKLTNKEKK